MSDFFALVLILILALVFFAFLSWLAYLVIYLPTAWIIQPNRLNTARLILSPLIVILAFIIYYSTHGSSNSDTAIIEKIGDDYQLTLKGQRALIVHDPISALIAETYSDSVLMTIPRAEGIINGEEIQGNSRRKTWGSLKIEKGKIYVDLYYDNPDSKVKEPLSWNGNYKLKWKSDN
jgi:membrane protein implicated in regulation of membrane protease activity